MTNGTTLDTSLFTPTLERTVYGDCVFHFVQASRVPG